MDVSPEMTVRSNVGFNEYFNVQSRSLGAQVLINTRKCVPNEKKRDVRNINVCNLGVDHDLSNLMQLSELTLVVLLSVKGNNCSHLSGM